LQNGLAQMGISEPVKRLVTGAVIIFAVIIDKWRSHS
jgi:ribose transport system permease protein